MYILGLDIEANPTIHKKSIQMEKNMHMPRR
jgi:hypothetical protein